MSEENLAKLLPILQNAMHKAKGFSREELLSSGMFEKIVAESIEDLEPLCGEMDKVDKEKISPEVIQGMMNDPAKMDEVQDIIQKLF